MKTNCPLHGRGGGPQYSSGNIGKLTVLHGLGWQWLWWRVGSDTIVFNFRPSELCLVVVGQKYHKHNTSRPSQAAGSYGRKCGATTPTPTPDVHEPPPTRRRLYSKTPAEGTVYIPIALNENADDHAGLPLCAF